MPIALGMPTTDSRPSRGFAGFALAGSSGLRMSRIAGVEAETGLLHKVDDASVALSGM